ncbi:two-component regulator propeller domain-containing protein [Flavobacterium sp. NPDC079362]|uniref:two-component regulator propeller domain-containing protein n=1 Tax=Flavobacterium sp. NPDC079362 TaxID=3390566 RepID=UPI003D08DDDB
MKLKLDSQYIFNLCCIFLIFATISCTNQTKKSNQPVENKNNTIRLKYTTGIRSILEDSKGNIWFGSYNEGVCLLQNGNLQYFTTENGLSHNQVRNIYEDRNGIV